MTTYTLRLTVPGKHAEIIEPGLDIFDDATLVGSSETPEATLVFDVSGENLFAAIVHATNALGDLLPQVLAADDGWLRWDVEDGGIDVRLAVER